LALAVALLSLTACRPQKLPVLLGYSSETPMAFIDIQNGISIEFYDIQYRKQGKEQALSGYKERITLPSGKMIALEFEAVGQTRYFVRIDGKRRKGPDAEEFKKKKESSQGKLGFAPSFKGDDLYLFFFNPVSQGSYNFERTDKYVEGTPYLEKMKRTYKDQTYTFTYSDWKWSGAGAMPPVKGFKVSLAIAPTVAEAAAK